MQPFALFDNVKLKCGIRSDTRLARVLEYDKGHISKVRNGIEPVTRALLERLHEISDCPISQLREWAALPPPLFASNTMLVAPEIVEKVKALPRYFEQYGKLYAGGVSTHNFIRLDAVLALLEKP